MSSILAAECKLIIVDDGPVTGKGKLNVRFSEWNGLLLSDYLLMLTVVPRSDCRIYIRYKTR
jgi:hypothetical protein